MAMNAEALGIKIGNTLFDAIPADIVDSMSESQKTETKTALQNSWKDIANEIVNHITTNAEVTVAAGILLSAGPYAGSTTATGKGTIS